jgi:hypothetical protein
MSFSRERPEIFSMFVTEVLGQGGAGHREGLHGASRLQALDREVAGIQRHELGQSPGGRALGQSLAQGALHVQGQEDPLSDRPGLEAQGRSHRLDALQPDGGRRILLADRGGQAGQGLDVGAQVAVGVLSQDGHLLVSGFLAGQALVSAGHGGLEHQVGVELRAGLGRNPAKFDHQLIAHEAPGGGEPILGEEPLILKVPLGEVLGAGLAAQARQGLQVLHGVQESGAARALQVGHQQQPPALGPFGRRIDGHDGLANQQSPEPAD